MTDCPCEETLQHASSPGLVADDEIVCRGAYDPMHFKKNRIRTNFVKRKDLASGQLSVWRLGRDPNFDAETLAIVLKEVAPPEQGLGAIMAAAAGQIRQTTMPDHFPNGQRVFCVADDCRTDDVGGWHPEHATVSLAQINDFAWDQDSDHFIAAVEALAAILKRKQVWPTS
jgi:hypothetical protein